MFEVPGSREVASVEPLLDDLADCDLPGILRGHHARIAREQFREIDAVTTVYFTRCSEDASRGINEAHEGEYTHIEVAGTLRITEYEANRMIDLGVGLRLRLHRTSKAFAAGTIDLGKAQAINDVLVNVSDDKLDLIERLLLVGAAEQSRNKLKAKARRLINKHDPNGARKRRESAQDGRGVWLTADEDGMVELSGKLSAATGQALGMRLRAMSFQVCGNDPRTLPQRRADALEVLAYGGHRLECRCGQGGACPKRLVPTDGEAGSTGNHGDGDSTSAPDRVGGVATADPEAKDPAVGGVDSDDSAADGFENEQHSPTGDAESHTTVLVGVNASTLLGLDDLPGYLHGHGSIDAEHARELSANATWRQVLTLTEADRERLIDSLIDALLQSGYTIDGPELKSDVGARDDSAEWVNGHRVDTSVPGPILGIGKALDKGGIASSVIRNRTRARREELTYRPSVRLARIVRTRDGTCRFPNCTERAENCDLDHTVPFDRDHPELGGPTTELNLACLCRRHHRLKTQGYWKVRQIGGGRLEWTDPNGEKVVTVPGGPFCDSDAWDGRGLSNHRGLSDQGGVSDDHDAPDGSGAPDGNGVPDNHTVASERGLPDEHGASHPPDMRDPDSATESVCSSDGAPDCTDSTPDAAPVRPTGRARTEADLTARGIDPSVLTDQATLDRMFAEMCSPVLSDLEFLLDLNAPGWRTPDPELDRMIHEIRSAGGDYVGAARIGEPVNVDPAMFPPLSPPPPRPDEPPPF